MAAAVIAGALRAELQAEPVATACGAPVTVRTPFRAGQEGHEVAEYEVVFVRGERRARQTRNHWLPLASHRLRIHTGSHGAQPERAATSHTVGHTVHATRLHKALQGFGAATTNIVRVRIVDEPQATPPSAIVSLFADPRHRLRLAPIIERTLRLATQCDDGGPGLAEPNLAAWRLAELLRAADAAGDDDSRRGNLLRRAARQPNAPSFVHAQLATLARREGRHEAAAQHWNCAVLSETDPLRRSRLQRLWRNPSNPDGSLRDEAMDRLLVGDTTNAEQLLHTARRRRSDPAADYQLLGYVHRQRGDDMAALAAELLAREHDESSAAKGATSGAFARGQAGRAASLAPKLPAGVLPLRASATLYGPLRATATPPR